MTHSDEKKEMMNCEKIMLWDTERDEEMGESHTIFGIGDVISIVESYEPLTIFSNLAIWKRDAITLEEAVNILIDVCHDVDTFSNLLRMMIRARYIWLSKSSDVIYHPLSSPILRQKIFCKVVARGSYECHRVVYSLLFPSKTVKSEHVSSWRSDTFYDEMYYVDEATPISFNWYESIVKHVDVEDFKVVYPKERSAMDSRSFLGLTRQALLCSPDHLRYLRTLFRNIPESLMGGYAGDLLTCEINDTSLYSIWENKDLPLLEKVRKISEKISGQIFTYSSLWSQMRNLSVKFSSTLSAIHSHVGDILSLPEQDSKSIVSFLRDIFVKSFIQHAKEEANEILSSSLTSIVISLCGSGWGWDCSVAPILIREGFILRHDIHKIAHLVRNSDWIEDVIRIYGTFSVLAVAMSMSSELKEMKKCHLVGHVGKCLNLIPRSEIEAEKKENNMTLAGIDNCLRGYRMLRGDHLCSSCSSLESLIDMLDGMDPLRCLMEEVE